MGIGGKSRRASLDIILDDAKVSIPGKRKLKFGDVEHQHDYNCCCLYYRLSRCCPVHGFGKLNAQTQDIKPPLGIKPI